MSGVLGPVVGPVVGPATVTVVRSGTAGQLRPGFRGRVTGSGQGCRRVEQRPAQVVQQPQPGGGHGEAAPAAAGPVQDRPDQRGAAVLAGQPADDLHPAAGLAKGPFDEVGVPDPIPVLPGEAQVDGCLLYTSDAAENREV